MRALPSRLAANPSPASGGGKQNIHSSADTDRQEDLVNGNFVSIIIMANAEYVSEALKEVDLNKEKEDGDPTCDFCKKPNPTKRCSKRHARCLKKMFCDKVCETSGHLKEKKKGSEEEEKKAVEDEDEGDKSASSSEAGKAAAKAKKKKARKAALASKREKGSEWINCASASNY